MRPNAFHDTLLANLIQKWTHNILHEKIWRDAKVQFEVSTMLALHWDTLVFKTHDVYIKETSYKSGITENKCGTCMDAFNHNDGKCIPVSPLKPSITGNLEQVRSYDFSQIAAVWIGNLNTLTEYGPHSDRYAILNMTDKSQYLRIPTGSVMGQKVILKSRSQHISKFASLMDHIRECIAFLPGNTHIPVFVNLTLESDQVDNMETTFVSITAFVAQIDALRKRYGTSFVVIGALPRLVMRMTNKDYKSELRKSQIVNNIAGVLCGRANIIFVPPQGFLYSCFDLRSGSGSWSMQQCLPGFSNEKLFNPNLTCTREFRRRLNNLVDSVIDIHFKVNVQSPFFALFRKNLSLGDPSLYYRGK
jgi:hypothetical protein